MNEPEHPMTPLRRAAIAATLSFLIPGAGLWWLGHRRLAAMNFILATAFVAALWVIVTGALAENFHYVLLIAAAASAGLAHTIALHPALLTPAPKKA